MNVYFVLNINKKTLKYNVITIGFISVSFGSGQTKDYKIGICCFSAKHAVLRRKSKDWLVRNQDNVSELGDMSIRGLLFHVDPVQSRPHHYFIENELVFPMI